MNTIKKVTVELLAAVLGVTLMWGLIAHGATKGDQLPKGFGGAVQVLTGSAIAIPTSGMVGRNSVAIFNNGPNTIWCGWRSTVTNVTGFPVGPQSALNIDIVLIGNSPDLYCRADTADQVSPADTRYMEVK